MAKNQTSGNFEACSKTGDPPANDRVPSDIHKSGKLSAARDMFEKGNDNGREAKPFKFHQLQSGRPEVSKVFFPSNSATFTTLV